MTFREFDAVNYSEFTVVFVDKIRLIIDRFGSDDYIVKTYGDREITQIEPYDSHIIRVYLDRHNSLK